MKMRRWYCSVVLILFLVTAAMADDFSDGLHGMKWGSAVGDHPNLVLDHEADSAAYYVDARTVYQVSNKQVDRLIYGFYKGQLFAGFIDLALPVQFVNLKEHLTSRYGPPAVEYGREGRPTVYRWKAGRIKIKLKIRESGNEMKMAIYYTPLSDKLNEERLEKQAASQRRLLPIERGKTPEMVPLFKF